MEKTHTSWWGDHNASILFLCIFMTIGILWSGFFILTAEYAFQHADCNQNYAAYHFLGMGVSGIIQMFIITHLIMVNEIRRLLQSPTPHILQMTECAVLMILATYNGVASVLVRDPCWHLMGRFDQFSASIQWIMIASFFLTWLNLREKEF